MIVRKDCRCCHGVVLNEVLNLGEQPYANAFLKDRGDMSFSAPLVLLECASCGHVQLQHVIPPGDLFTEYAFQTASSAKMVEHFSALLKRVVDSYVPDKGLVVEIGSNDGSALASLNGRDVRCLGIDPAANLAKLAALRGVSTVTAFFNENTASMVALEHGQADAIVACNVLGHIDNLDDFCRGVNALLAPDGVIVIEVPLVERMIEETAFDTVYHEHLSYFSVYSLSVLFSRYDFHVQNVEYQSVHCGSIRVTLSRSAGVAVKDSTRPRDWWAFNDRCESLRNSFVAWLHDQRDAGKTVWGYCAAAKATVLLNYCGVDYNMLPVVVDNTPAKQGHYTPGTLQQVLPPYELERQKPDAVVVLASNHFNEIVQREFAYIQSGGQIINPRNL